LADGRKLVITMPDTPEAVGDPPTVPGTIMMVWKMKVQLALQQTAALDANLESVYALIKGQCSKPILEKVEAQHDYRAVHDTRDPIGLLEVIKGVMFNYNSRKYLAVAIIDIMKPNIVSQARYMSDSEYLNKFRTQLDVLKSAGGDMCRHPGLVLDELDKVEIETPPSAAEKATAVANARTRFEGTLFLMKSNQAKYG
jgi:hypothetical protein